ncbi:N-acetylmuramate alpha-1-phosphate uridylyltransferase [Rhodobacteraceae bacterium IMCC1909]|nr:N-acetylmuramate alpha-1-phosphate uridylyltransferase [Rhodobacteraceae bacterium IMCC1909]
MRQPPHELMLFAAGFGSRMQPLTADLPKPLITVAGTSLLDRTLTLAKAGGITKTVVKTHYLGEKITKHLENCPVQVLHEPNILDTGGGLKNASPLFDGPAVFTSNSDAVWSGPNPFAHLFQNWQDDCDALLLCAPVNQIIGRAAPGDFSISQDAIVTRGGDFVYLGVQIIQLETIQHIREPQFSLNIIWDALMAKNTLRACLYPGQWCDIGKPENIALGEKLLGTDHV